jgi:hypothetical protein
VLEVSRGTCSEEEYERLRKGVGHAIGAIQVHILNIVNTDHPELDDLR